MSFLPQYKGIGIGSLPFTDTNEALELIRKKLPEIPHWPQLPKRGRAEHFIYQCLNPLVQLGIIVVEDDHIYVEEEKSNWEEMLTEFYTKFLAAQEGDGNSLEWFAVPQESAVGLYSFLENIKENPGDTICVKGQMAGPLSVALNITDRNKKPAYYNPQTRDILIKALAMQARWQAVKLGELGYPAMVFADDPALSAVGVSTYITLSKEQVMSDLKEIVNEVHAADALAGAHSCAGVDWSMFMEAGFDIISFDAYEYFPSLLGHIELLNDYLQQGGALAWGIVPTSYKVLQQKLPNLLNKFEEQIEQLLKKGIAEDVLRRQIYIAPSCGAGTLTVEEAEKIYEFTNLLSIELSSR